MLTEQQLNIKFVEEIEKYPCLYNYKLPEYMKKDTTEKVWGEIGNKFQLSGPECKERWKNLRSVFVRHLKPPKNGSVTTQKKPYYLADYMQFTIPFIKFVGNVSVNLSETSHAIYFKDEHRLLPQSSLSTQSEAEIPPSTSSSILKQKPSTSSVRLQPQSTLSPTRAASELQQGQTRPKKNSRRKGLTLETDISNYLKMKQAKLIASSENTEQNSNKMFLLSVLSDMNKMNDKQRRVFKRRLLALVDEIMEEVQDIVSTPSPSNAELRNSTINEDSNS